VRLLTRAARNGVASALTTLGELKRRGHAAGDPPAPVVDAKPEEARLLLDMAGKLGDRHALYALSHMHVNGEGGPACPETGFALARRAASDGSAAQAGTLSAWLGKGPGAGAPRGSAGQTEPGAEPALPHHQFNLGNHHYFGVGTPVDFEEAARWYGAAAERGYAEAQINLGAMRRDGRGVPRSVEDAKRLFALAARGGEGGSGAASSARAAQAEALLAELEAEPDLVVEEARSEEPRGEEPRGEEPRGEEPRGERAGPAARSGPRRA
jgi:TPR repeat protein